MSEKNEFGYRPEERKIFRFMEGDKPRAVDPLRVLRRIREKSADTLEDAEKAIRLWERLETGADAGESKPMSDNLVGQAAARAMEAGQQIEDAARYAFEIQDGKEVDGEWVGMTAAEVLDVYWQWRLFMANLRENVRPLQSSPPTSDTSAAPNGSPTPSSSDSSPAATKSESDGPPR